MIRRGIWPAILLAGAGLLLLAFAIPNLAPAIRAARAEGVKGTFTAERLACVQQHPGHEQCTWYGRFHSAERDREVTLYGAGRTTVHAGEQVPAVDVEGRPLRVYPPSGSREWIVVAVVIAVACGLLAFATRRISHLSRAGIVRP